MEFNRRNYQKAVVDRCLRFTQSAEFGEADVVQLQDRLRLLENAFERFQTEHLAVLEENVLPQDMAVQEEVATDVETSFLTASAKIRERINELQPIRDVPPNGAQNGNHLPHFAGANDLRLERIPMNVFEGEYAQWSEWKAMFESLVHNVPTLSDTQKFHYLKRSVNGSAARVLSGWQILGENYQAAYESLVHIYENKYRIIIAHLEELNSMPKLTHETNEGLRSMIDTTNRVLRQLASPAIGAPVQHWDFLIVHLLLVRCPSRTLSTWETTHHQTEMPTLAQFIDFLNQRAMSMVTLGQTNTQTNATVRTQSNSANNGATAMGGFKPKNGHSKSTNNGRHSASDNNQQRSLSCYNCKQPHQMYRCLAFQQLTLEQRKHRVRELNLCANCFMPGHRAGTQQCRFGTCRRCNRNQYHNTLLCDHSVATVAISQQRGPVSWSDSNNASNSNHDANRQNFQ